jgi:hypothetical protein
MLLLKKTFAFTFETKCLEEVRLLMVRVLLMFASSTVVRPPAGLVAR